MACPLVAVSGGVCDSGRCSSSTYSVQYHSGTVLGSGHTVGVHTEWVAHCTAYAGCVRMDSGRVVGLCPLRVHPATAYGSRHSAHGLRP